jgi:tRNA threonylcarbamoyl adenosine modification protein YjeE
VPATGEGTDLRLSRAELERWGEAFGAGLAPGAIVALHGDLGAGKTTLVQAICRGYGVRDEVTSPTYALVHEYAAPRSVVQHLDLYRLDAPADLTNLGFDDMLGADAVLLVEWPERAGDRLPMERIDIRLSHVAEDAGVRRLEVGS